MNEHSFAVLDKGFVRLDAYMADDLSVVNSARVSFAKFSTELGDAERGLIRFLMKNRHGTPFEHNSFRFHVKCPIFVAREWMRHRIGSYNEWSGRYSKLEAEFYIPREMRTQVGKPGHYKFEPLESQIDNQLAYDSMLASCEHAFETYEYLLSIDVAKEVARMVLPVNTYTQFIWTANLRSIMNFLSLRNAEDAMFEIREYAKVVEALVTEMMPVSMQAFVENNRIAP